MRGTAEQLAASNREGRARPPIEATPSSQEELRARRTPKPEGSISYRNVVTMPLYSSWWKPRPTAFSRELIFAPRAFAASRLCAPAGISTMAPTSSMQSQCRTPP